MPNYSALSERESRTREPRTFSLPNDGPLSGDSLPSFWLRIWSLLHDDDGESTPARRPIARQRCH